MSEMLVSVGADQASDAWGFVGVVKVGEHEAYRTLEAFSTPSDAAAEAPRLMATVLDELLAGCEWRQMRDQVGAVPLRRDFAMDAFKKHGDLKPNFRDLGSGEGAQVGEQVGEAGDGQAVGGLPGGVLGLRGGRAARWFDGAVTGGDVIVSEGEFGEGLAQVPDQVGGEHAQEHVGADTGFEVVPHGPQVQIVDLDVSEVAFHEGEVLVLGDQLRGGHGGFVDAGADDVQAVQAGLASILDWSRR